MLNIFPIFHPVAEAKISGGHMRLRIFVIGAILILTCGWADSARAQALSGDQLLFMLTGEASSSFQTNVNRYRAMGYIQGLLDSYTVFSTRDPSLNIYCMPLKGVSSSRARKVIIKWLEEHPKRLNEQARILVFHALAEAFPCITQKPTPKSDQQRTFTIPQQN
jgi:hypothetical protein